MISQALRIVAAMPAQGLNPTHSTWNHITTSAADCHRSDVLRQVCPPPLSSPFLFFVILLTWHHEGSSLPHNLKYSSHAVGCYLDMLLKKSFINAMHSDRPLAGP